MVRKEVIKMRQKITLIMVTLLIVTMAAGTAFARGGCSRAGKGERGHKGRMEMMCKKLGLTEDQEARLKSVKEANREAMGNLRLALKEKQGTLREELSKPGVTRQAVEPLVAEVKALEAGLTEARIDGIFKVKEVLTPEQFARLQAGKGPKHKEGIMKNFRKGR